MPRNDGATSRKGKNHVPQVKKSDFRGHYIRHFARVFGFRPKALLRHLQAMDAASAASRD